MAIARQRRTGQGAPPVRRRVVGDAVREGIAAAAAAPAEHLLAGPDDGREAVVDAEEPRRGQLTPAIAAGVVTEPGALAPDEHFLPGPHRGEIHEPRRVLGRV